MEDPTLLRLIAQRSDDSTLEVLSHTPLWGTLQPELEDQHFWYQRTETAFNLPPEFQWEYGDNRFENWQQVYNILASTKTMKNPFTVRLEGPLPLEANGYNLIGIKLLLRMGYRPIDMVAIDRAIRYASLDVIKLLLADPGLDVGGDTVSINCMKRAVEMGRLDIVEVLVEAAKARGHVDDELGLWFILSGLFLAIKLEQVEIVKYLLKARKRYKKELLSQLIGGAITSQSVKSLKVLLHGFKPTELDLAMYAGFAISEGKDRALETILKRMKGTQPDTVLTWLSTAVKMGNVPILRTLMSKFSRRGELERRFLFAICKSTESVNREVLAFLASGKYITPKDVAEAYRLAEENGNDVALEVLLAR